MTWLKQSTAVTVVLGPFVDSTDGVTSETALTISQADIRLSKNGAAFAQTNNAAGATHMENGNYSVPLNTTDTNTLGTLRVAVAESGALPVWRDFMVVPANVWDSMFGADLLQVDLTQVSGAAVSASSAQLGVNVVNVGGSAVSASAGLLNANVTQISGDSAAADNLEAAADGTGYNLGGGSVVAASVTGNVGGNVTGSIGSLAAQAKADVNAEVDSALDTAVPGTPTAGSINERVKTMDDADIPATLTSMDGKLDTIDNFLDTEVAAILAAVDTEIATIDTVVDAIKAKTDSLTFTTANRVDAQVFGMESGTITTTAHAAGAIDAAAVAADVSAEIIAALAAQALSGYTSAGTWGNAQRELSLGSRGVVGFTAQTGSSTTAIITNLTEATDDHYNGRTVVFTTGALAGQAATISDYAGATKTITVAAMTDSPANGDIGVII